PRAAPGGPLAARAALLAVPCGLLTAPSCCLPYALRCPSSPRYACYATMASLRVLQFDTWLDDLQLYLLSDSRDNVSLFDHTSGAAPAPPATAHALYNAVVARYSSPATAALGRLLLPYLFPELSAFATVEDLVSQLLTSDARYRAAAAAEARTLLACAAHLPASAAKTFFPARVAPRAPALRGPSHGPSRGPSHGPSPSRGPSHGPSWPLSRPFAAPLPAPRGPSQGPSRPLARPLTAPRAAPRGPSRPPAAPSPPVAALTPNAAAPSPAAAAPSPPAAAPPPPFSATAAALPRPRRRPQRPRRRLQRPHHWV
ncbi:unnamed protein product, partial [Closterium sp. NIES-54]